jgi:endonuclease YncB( thermonuclease family)
MQLSAGTFLLLCLSILHVTPTRSLWIAIDNPSLPSTTTTFEASTTWQPSSSIEGTFLLSSLNEKQQQQQQSLAAFSTRDFQRDQVVRILDANTIKLQKNGIVSLAGVRMPTPGKSSNFQFPDCLSYGPTYKLRQLIPKNTAVLVKVVTQQQKQQAVVIRSVDSVLVNQELVRAGFGRVQKVSNPDLKEILDLSLLQSLQEEAKTKGLGIFQRCDEVATVVEAQFEPLELTVETQWGDDGGKQVLRQKENYSKGPPKNPGDKKGKSFIFFTCAVAFQTTHIGFSQPSTYVQDARTLKRMRMHFVGSRSTNHIMAMLQSLIVMATVFLVRGFLTQVCKRSTE